MLAMSRWSRPRGVMLHLEAIDHPLGLIDRPRPDVPRTLIPSPSLPTDSPFPRYTNCGDVPSADYLGQPCATSAAMQSRILSGRSYQSNAFSWPQERYSGSWGDKCLHHCGPRFSSVQLPTDVGNLRKNPFFTASFDVERRARMQAMFLRQARYAQPSARRISRRSS